MRSRIRSHIRSQGVGYVALFLVVAGGTAYATHPGGANTISSEDIINGQVKQPDVGLDAVNSPRIANQAVNDNDLAPDAVKGAKVVDDTLTGNDINEPSLGLGAAAWDEVGDGDGPAFNSTAFCAWSNFGGDRNTAAFARDRHGVVHLKGTVDADDLQPDPNDCLFDPGQVDPLIFTLPSGYRPALREVFSTLAFDTLARVNVDGPSLVGMPAGGVSVDPPTTEGAAEEWLSLDGISFRCAPSGSNGCP